MAIKSAHKTKIILGIDPGLADTGFGLIERSGNNLTALDFGSIKTHKNTPMPQRLLELHLALDKIINKYKPDLIGIEKLFFCKNVTTAMVVGQARGVVILTATKHKIPIVEFTPLEIKQATTGYGKADKKQMQNMIKMLLKLNHPPQPDDAADALGVAVCASNHRNYEK